MEDNIVDNMEEKKPIFVCEVCDVKCYWKSEVKKHLETLRHKKRELSTKVNQLECECGKKYKHRSNLSYHRKTCEVYNDIIKKLNIIENKTESQEIINYNESKNNTSEIKNFILNEFENIKEQITFNMKDQLNSQIDEKLISHIDDKINSSMDKIITTIKNNTSQNITINNQQNNFNLTVFLNEHCKDALNMSEFIDTLDISPYTLQYTGEHGYAEGITKIFVDGLNELDVCKRPIHCTDLKRETLYIKENDTWEKDTENKDGLLKTINIVAKKNRKEMEKWQRENPKYDFVDTREYELHIHIMRESLGGGIKTKKNTRKIISNISRYTLINKSKYCMKKI